jgi:hypothetical protein
MKMNKEWLKFTAGVIGFVAVALLISYVIQSPAQAELDSIERNPGNDKVIEDTVNEDTVTVDRVTELGTAMKLWAIGFGMEAEKNAVETKQAFLNDVDRLQQSKFWQYQVDGWAQGQQDLAKTGEDIKNLPSNIATGIQEAPAKIENFINSTSSGIGNWFMNEWDSIVEYQKKSWQAE